MSVTNSMGWNGGAFTVWGAEPYGEQPPGLPQQVEAIARQVQEIREALARMQEWAGRLPVHLAVDTVEHLAFHFDSIDINDLGGELNIGLTSSTPSSNPFESAGRRHRRERSNMAPKARQPAGQQPVLAPPVDILREGDALILIFAIPGVRAEDFRISLVGNRQIYIEGTIPHRGPVPREHMSQAEIPTGPFARTVDLPYPVDGSGAQVAFQNGLLTVRLPVRLERLSLHWQPLTGGEHHAQPY